MTKKVIAARVVMRRLATSKLFSVTCANLRLLSPSWVNACTVWADNSASDADPELAAIQS